MLGFKRKVVLLFEFLGIESLPNDHAVIVSNGTPNVHMGVF